jgi:hypothetical protein
MQKYLFFFHVKFSKTLQFNGIKSRVKYRTIYFSSRLGSAIYGVGYYKLLYLTQLKKYNKISR